MQGCEFLSYFPGLGGFFPGGIVHVLLWGLIILVLVYLAGKLIGAISSDRVRENRDRVDSLSILKMRFARGEISREDYLRMREILEQSP